MRSPWEGTGEIAPRDDGKVGQTWAQLRAEGMPEMEVTQMA